MGTFRTLSVLAVGVIAAAATPATAAVFITGDIVVSVEGNGADTASGGAAATGNTAAGDTDLYLDNQAAPLSLYEFNTTGSHQSPVKTLTLPQTTVGANSAFSGEYGSSSEATLELSGDGKTLLIAGYGVNAASYNSQQDLNGAGTALAQSCSLSSCGGSAVSRVIAEIGANGAVDTSTVLYNVFNTNNPRSVASQDGKTLYISGQGDSGSTNEGVFETTLGSSSSNALYTTFDTRTVEIYDGQLFMSLDSKAGSGQTAFIASLGSGLPTSGAQTATRLLDISTGSKKSPFPGSLALSGGDGNAINGSTGNVFLSPENFFFANASTLYVADSGDPKAGGVGDGGLQKWSLVGGTWELDYTLSAGLNLVDSTTAGCAVSVASLSENADCTTGLEGLTGKVVGDQVELYATSFTLGDDNASYLYGIGDTLSDTQASQVTGESFDELAEAPADSNFKGVAFAPTGAPEPTTWSLMFVGVGALGAALRGLSRRSRLAIA